MSTADPITVALTGAIRPLLEELLDQQRQALRADVRRALAELRSGDGGPEAAALDARRAAAYLGVSQRTIHRMKADGRLPHVKIGRQLRFKRVDLDALLES